VTTLAFLTRNTYRSNTLLKEMEQRSLEKVSVRALIAASDLQDALPLYPTADIFHSRLSKSCKQLPPALLKPRNRRFVQPCLRTNCSLVIRKSNLIGKNLTIESCHILGDPGNTSKPLQQSLINSESAVKCRCLFIGGGGFKITNSDTPCQSRACINRARTKFDWEPRDPGSISLSRVRSRLDGHLVRSKPRILRLTREEGIYEKEEIRQRPMLIRRKDDQINTSFPAHSCLPKIFP
jgi:hypothetical protein